jgi:hypothetical protein
VENIFLKGINLIIIILFVLVLGSCVTLSQKAEEENIKIVTSPYMVEGMQNVYAYTTDGTVYSVNEMGIVAANNAAKEGWSDITILVKYIGSSGILSGGVFVPTYIYEISYWK